MTFNLTKKKVGDCIDVTDFVANGSFASLKANVQYLDNASPDKFAVLVRTLDFNRNWNGEYVWVDKAAYHFLKKSSLIQGDLVLCNVGSVGIVFEVPDLGLPMTLGPNSVLCRTKDINIIRQRFIYYYFLSSVGQALLEELSGGSTVQPKFNKTVLRNSEIDIPDLAHQDFIAHTLGILDSKISTNAAISKTLEDIAQTIFKSWFIDFDPVKAKMAGEKPVGMDASTAALFPDSMEESELGLIPKGWKAGTIGEICDSVVNGSTPLRTNSAYWSSDDISWFKTGELSDNFLFESKESITQLALEKTSVKVLPRGSVLMAIYAAPTVGRLGILTKSASFNQACTGMVAKNKFGTPYLYLTLFNRRFWFNSLAIGAAQQNISKVIVEGCPAITASQDVHNAFLKITEPIFTQIETLGRQSNSLALIRDSLLPRLISGELQIPDEMLAS
jgi:type I restriction enzyme S subunit